MTKETTPGQKEYEQIMQAREIARNGAFKNKFVHESAEFEAKKAIMQEKGEGARAYLDTFAGIQEYADKLMQNVNTQIAPKLSHLPIDEQLSLMASYMPNKDDLIETLKKYGSSYDFGIHKELVKGQLAMQQNSLNTHKTNYDKTANPHLAKKIGIDRFLTDLEDLTNEQISQLVIADNRGGSPQGPDSLMQVGLGPKLKPEYQIK